MTSLEARISARAPNTHYKFSEYYQPPIPQVDWKLLIIFRERKQLLNYMNFFFFFNFWIYVYICWSFAIRLKYPNQKFYSFTLKIKSPQHFIFLLQWRGKSLFVTFAKVRITAACPQGQGSVNRSCTEHTERPVPLTPVSALHYQALLSLPSAALLPDRPTKGPSWRVGICWQWLCGICQVPVVRDQHPRAASAPQ